MMKAMYKKSKVFSYEVNDWPFKMAMAEAASANCSWLLRHYSKKLIYS